MSETVVVLKTKDHCKEFEALVSQHGLTAERVDGLPRFFIFPDMIPSQFPLADYPGINTIEDGEHEIEPEDSTGEPQMHHLRYGGWAPSRIINRKSPWKPPNHGPDAKAPFQCRRTGEGVDVFMIDSGCYIDHAEFEGRAQQPFLLKEHYNAPLDDTGHGTACLSVVGGKTLGIARGAQLYSYKFHNGERGATTTGFIKAMGAIMEYYERHRDLNRPGILFCSWGRFGSTINSAITDCIDIGLICCFPAGNHLADLDAVDYYPAEGDPDAIICGGINIHDRPYYTFDGYGSGFGSPVDILAPGQQVVVARRVEDHGDYRHANGTSYATPYVVSVLACMLEGYNQLTSREEVRVLKNQLLANATQGELLRGYAPGSLFPDPEDPDKDTHRLPDRILYLDPTVPFETIPGLTPKKPRE